MAARRWRLLIEESTDPRLNLAREEAIARSVGKGEAPSTLRLWRNSDCVVIGCFQDPRLEASLEFCEQAGIALVRRFSGGGAVYHDLGNLNWTLVMAKSNELARSGPHSVALKLSRPVVLALHELGVVAYQASPYQIESRGKKVSGSALAIRWGSLAYHGTLLIDADLRKMEMALSPKEPLTPPKKRYTRSRRSEVTNLAIEMGRRMPLGEIINVLVRAFEQALSIEARLGGATSQELKLAQLLYERKYSTDEWNIEGMCPEGLW